MLENSWNKWKRFSKKVELFQLDKPIVWDKPVVCVKTNFYLTSLSGMNHASPEMALCNTYNFWMYVPDFTFQINNSNEKVTVWGGMSRNWILLESYFFERNVDGGN